MASESCLTLLFVRSVPSVSFVQNGDLIDLLLLLLIDPYMSQTACFGSKRNTYGSMSFLLEFGWRRKKEWWIVCTWWNGHEKQKPIGDHQSLLCTQPRTWSWIIRLAASCHYGLSEVQFVQTSNHLRWTEVQVQHVDGRIMSRDKQAGLCSQKITIQSSCSGICIARSWRRRTDFFDCWPPCSSRNLNILKHLIGPWAVRAWHTLTSLNMFKPIYEDPQQIHIIFYKFMIHNSLILLALKWP